MGKRFLLIIVILVLSAAYPVFAAEADSGGSKVYSDLSAGQLLSYCKSVFSKKGNHENGAFCLGYIQGLTDGNAMAQHDGGQICLKGGTNTGAVTKTFVKEASHWPGDKLAYPAVTALTAILRRANPCPGD